MNFTYEITYQNKQDMTLTVVYFPASTKALATVGIIQYEPFDTPERITHKILAQAPISEWQRAMSQEVEDVVLGTFTSTAADVTAAVAVMYPPLPEPPFEELQYLKKEEVDEWRNGAEQRGAPYTFPANKKDIIQVRHERDQANIVGLSTSALILKSKGVTDPVFTFRAASNTSYDMTPDQMLDMGVAVSTFIAGLYEISWALKKQVEESTTEAELAAIEWPA